MIKVIFDKNTLIDAVSPALCAVSERNTLKAMEGIYFKCEGDNCEMNAYDMEKGVRQYIPVICDEPCEFIVNANKLFRIIRTLPGPNIKIEIDEKNICKISSGTSCFEMHALPGKDFPSMPHLEGQNTFKLKVEFLKDMINRVQHAIAVNDQRMALNGAFFQLREGKLKVVATDGNRMAIRECECENTGLYMEKGGDQLNFIVPGKTLTELLKLMADDEEIEIATTYRHIMFFLKKMTFFSRLIDTEYVPYERYLRAESPVSVYISREAFLGAAERASLVTEERTVGQAKSSLKCSFEGNVLHVYADNLNGRVDDNISIEKTGDDMFIAFNCRYLLDALRACPEDSLKLSLSSSLMSMQIEGASSDGEDKFLYMVLPVRIN